MTGKPPEDIDVGFHDNKTGKDYTVPYAIVQETWDALVANLRRNPDRDELLAAVARRADAKQN